MPITDSLYKELMLERQKLGAKLRATRAILNLSQAEFAARVGLTQRSIHRLEQAQVEPKRVTIRAFERFWRSIGIAFVELPDGGFSISVTLATLCVADDTHSISPELEPASTFSERTLS